MPKVNVYNFEGQVVGTRELPAGMFGVRVDPHLLQQAVVAQQANARVAIAHTKTRGEVRGGGRKPWRQKGTGRARHGSIRSPIWIGGGITFGPRAERNFSLKINRKVRRLALLQSLSTKASTDAIRLVDDLTKLEGKTKPAAQLLGKLHLRPKRQPEAAVSPPAGEGVQPRQASVPARPRAARTPSILVVLPTGDVAVRAFRNLPRVGVIAADSLNVVDVLRHQYLLLSLAGLTQLEHVYGPTATAQPAPSAA